MPPNHPASPNDLQVSMNGEQSHILLVANPKSGDGTRQQLIGELHQQLESVGYYVQLSPSLELLGAQAAELWKSGKLRLIISAGGDGTVSAIANAVSPEVPILIFPMGTENLLAKHLGFKNADVGLAVQAVKEFKVRPFDAGEANGQLFLVMLSCGFDAEVVRQMASIRRGHISRFSYLRPILRALWQYTFPKISFDTPETAGSGGSAESRQPKPVAWFFAFNAPQYAANLKICPSADPTDGLLDFCTFEKPGCLAGFGYLFKLWFGRHKTDLGFSQWKGDTLKLKASDNPSATGSDSEALLEVPYQIDGDPAGFLPLTIRVLPQRLRLVQPPTNESV